MTLRLATWNCCAGPLDRKLEAARSLAAHAGHIFTIFPTDSWVDLRPALLRTRF